MISVVDTLVPVDRLAAWLPQWLPSAAAPYLVVPITVVAVLLVPRLTVRLVVPWVGRYVIVPLAALITGVITVVGLVLDIVAARLFRVFWLPLTSGHYAIGDWTIAGARGVRAVSRSGVAGLIRRLGHLPGEGLLVTGIAIVVLWNAGFCGRNPGAGCEAPLARWWHVTWVWWTSFSG